VSPGHHGFGPEVIRIDHIVLPSKSAIRFQRAAQRRFGLTPQAMDNMDAHVVKIRAKCSPKKICISLMEQHLAWMALLSEADFV